MRRTMLIALALLASCAGPLCPCTEPATGVELQGTLVSATGVPQPGKLVNVTVSNGACFTYAFPYVEALSDSTGLVRLQVPTFGSDTTCVRLWVRDNVLGATEREMPPTLRVRGSVWPYRTLTVPMVLRP